MQTLYELPGAARVVRLTRPDEVERLLTVLEGVACELRWQPGDDLRAWRESARHLAVMAGDTVAGGLQIVYGTGYNALPYRRVWPEVDATDAAGAAQVTILALERKHRGRPDLFGPLCVEMWRWCAADGIATIVIEATPATLAVYRRLGWPLEVIGGLRMHWGEECYLCRMGVRQVAEALAAKALQSPSHRRMVEQAYRDVPQERPLTAAVSL